MEYKNKFKTLNDITGATTQEIDRYYVYALYEKERTVPFYIGKGQGVRIFEHKNIAMNILAQISTESEENYIKLSSKITTIIRNNGEIVPVIIKFGLTSQEAFAVESSLINLCNYMAEKFNLNPLTNIVSGHGTKREKSTFSKDNQVKARTVDNFIENYNIPVFDASTIKDSCALIKINNTYNLGDSIEDVYEHVRGVWSIAEHRLLNLKYVLALYRGICVGVFKIDGWKKAYEHNERYPFPVRKDGLMEEKLVKYDKISTLKLNEPEIYEEIFSKKDNPQKVLDKWRTKRFFYSDLESKNIPKYLRCAVGKRVIVSTKDINNQANPIYLP